MNTTDTASLTTLDELTNATATKAPAVGPTTILPTQAETTIFHAATTVAPAGLDSAVVAVVVVLILLTVAALCFLLYRYMCHNKGDYRTTGEPAPGDDFNNDDDDSNQASTEKKEYFI
ncbi:unnamed protein product [Ophioblennius macclurei]